MLGALLVAAAAAHFTPPKLVGDWYVGCDNGGYCAAVGFPPEAAANDKPPLWYSIEIERGPAAGDKPRITIAVANPNAGSAKTDYRLQLFIDHKPTGLHFNAKGELVGDPFRTASLVANARSIELSRANGRVVGRVSMSGGLAALRTVDQRQRRTGTVTALIARGARPPSMIPPPPVLPKIATPARAAAGAVKLTRAQIGAIRKQYDCGEVAPTNIPEFVRLDSATTLGIIPCDLGAYQGSSAVVLISNSRTYRPATFERAYYREPSEAPDPANILTDPEFDRKTFSLRETVKGRGLGDCDSVRAYVWDGSRLRLAFQEEMDQCRLSLQLIPIWRTQNVSRPPKRIQ